MSRLPCRERSSDPNRPESTLTSEGFLGAIPAKLSGSMVSVGWCIVDLRILPVSIPDRCSAALRLGLDRWRRGDEALLLAALESYGERCCYGVADWSAVASALVQAVGISGGRSAAGMVDALEGLGLAEPTLSLCRDWVAEGPSWAPGLPYVSDGEHRLCAMRAQRVHQVVVFNAEA